MSIVTLGYGPDSSGPPPTPTGDSPTITIVSPAAGGIVTKFTPIVFTVTDASPLRRVFIYAIYSDSDVWEVIHDGGPSFSPTYTGGSNARNSISGGYRFTVLRDGGWPGSPTIHVYAVNTEGNGARI